MSRGFFVCALAMTSELTGCASADPELVIRALCLEATQSGRSTMPIEVLALVPSDCATCEGHVRDALERAAMRNERVSVFLTRDPSPSEKKQLVIARVRTSRVLSSSEVQALRVVDSSKVMSCVPLP